MILSILGIIGAGGIVSAYFWARELILSRRSLRFTGSEPLDIVVATSDVGKGGPEGDAYTRSVVSASNIEASVIVATASGALRQKKLVRVWLSENIRVGLEADLVIIGGQFKNQVAARYLVFFNQMYPDHQITRKTNEHSCHISVGEWSYDFDLTNEGRSENPTSDVVLVIADNNPFTLRKRRAILCAGFTSHGSVAGVRFAFEDRRSARRNPEGRSISPFRRGSYRYLAVLTVTIVNGIPSNSSILLWKDLP